MSIAIIPARGGSKRIPGKNIREFSGKPVIAYSIEAAIKSGLFSEIMVSTDNDEIAEIAKHYGAQVPFMRSARNSDDYSTTTDVLIEVLQTYESHNKVFETGCCIYSTAPFVTAEKLIDAFDTLKKNNFNSLFVAVPYSSPVQRGLKITGGNVSMMFPEHKNTRSQDLEPTYYDAGQFYMFRVQPLLKSGTFWNDPTGAIVVSEMEAQDMDTETDWKLAEMKYQFLNNK